MSQEKSLRQRIVDGTTAVKNAVSQLVFGAKIAIICAVKKKRPKRNFFILSQHRTGSGLVKNGLNSILGVSCNGEILSKFLKIGLRRWWISKNMVFQHVRNCLNYGYCPDYRYEDVRGAKIFFQDLEEFKISLEDFIKEFPEALWIVTYRKDILAQYISYEIALQTEIWTRYKDTPADNATQIYFDPIKAVQYRDRIKAYYRAAWETPLLRERSLWISYEELAEDPLAIFDKKILPFLKLLRQAVSINIVKQNLRKPAEIISNYSEIRELIEHTDFTHGHDFI